MIWNLLIGLGTFFIIVLIIEGIKRRKRYKKIMKKRGKK